MNQKSQWALVAHFLQRDVWADQTGRRSLLPSLFSEPELISGHVLINLPRGLQPMSHTDTKPLHSVACLSTWTVTLLSPPLSSDSLDTIQRCQVQAACKLTTVFNSTVFSGLDSLHPTLSWPLFCSQRVSLGVLCSTSEDATRWCPLCKPLMFSPGFCHPALTYCCSLLTAPPHGPAGQLLHFPGATYGGASAASSATFSSSTHL